MVLFKLFLVTKLNSTSRLLFLRVQTTSGFVVILSETLFHNLGGELETLAIRKAFAENRILPAAREQADDLPLFDV